MASQLVQDLIESGIHFGQRAAGWNPKMQPFIWGKRNGIHIIDIKETIKGLLLAKKFISRVVADGKDICFVGTKRQARGVLEQRVADVKMHYVTERWLGGTFTNFRTIRSRLKRLEEIEAIEQSGAFSSYSKKMESQLKREMSKIKTNLEGIRNMHKLPGAMVVIDVKRELNALAEARKLGIPTICLIDTDGDPDLADIAIPGNDDSMRSIDMVMRELCLAVSEGKQMRSAKAEAASGGIDMTAGGQFAGPGGRGGPIGPGGTGGPGDTGGPAGPGNPGGERAPDNGGRPRRSPRSQFRSDEPAAAAQDAGAVPADAAPSVTATSK